jgi:hypothetical protein
MTKAVTVARNARGELYFRIDTDGESLPGAVDE